MKKRDIGKREETAFLPYYNPKMSLRRLWTRAPHIPRTATSLSWSTAYLSRPTLQIPYRVAYLRFAVQKYEKQQHSFKAYSNYAPRDPSQYYGAYGQPPKSRASRLKDMAIGSALTIAVYIAYILHESRQTAQDERDVSAVDNEIGELIDHYDKLLTRAEAEDDGSPESAEHIHGVLKERAIAIMRWLQTWEEMPVEDLGPLPRFPEGHKDHGSEMVEDRDIVVLKPPPPPKEKLEDIDPEEKAFTIIHEMVVVVNHSTEDLGISNPMFYEIGCRLAIMMDNLCRVGTLDPDSPTLVMFCFRDRGEDYIYKHKLGTLIRLDRNQIDYV
ncbi:hypothetical protein F4801DRAFT_537845 [Xylaria longipes]|nr:hypothetical protein F4801DRAFT_537845 [Xylaria longipes]